MANNNVAVVFGGTGFIGSHLIRELVRRRLYSRIVAADMKEPQTRLPSVEYVLCDVRKPISIPGLGKGVDVEVFNLAAVHTTPGHEDWEYFWTNLHGAIEICRFATDVGAKLVVFSSSISVYGPTEEQRSEDDALEPDSAYGRSKLLAEKIHRAWQSSAPGRKLVIVRPAVIFGLGEGGNFTRLAATMKRGAFVYPGRRDTIKACGYVGGLVDSILFVREIVDTAVTYNFAYPQRYTMENICGAFSDVAGYSKPRWMVPYPLMALGGLLFEGLGAVGLKTSINRARMRKVIHSTNIYPKKLLDLGYKFSSDLPADLKQWQSESRDGGFD